MKTKFRLFPAAIILLAAVNIISCTKNEPVQNVVPAQRQYWPIEVASVPLFATGEEETVTVGVVTDLTPEEIAVTPSEGWITASVSRDGLTIGVTYNNTNDTRSGIVTVIARRKNGSTVTVKISQSPARCINAEGMVQFKDPRFKKACLAIADTNGDGDVSPKEAEAVEILDIPNRGIHDLTGLDAFKNVWKIDAHGNDIEDAMIITNLHKLHWLDLMGNMHLKCFDVRGCTSYFELCDFEVTDDLAYYLYWRQMGIQGKGGEVSSADDRLGYHCHHSHDPRRTQDWSRQGEFYQVHEHTKGSGDYAVVFSGIGWIDVDINDGTFERAVFETMDGQRENPNWEGDWDYLDVYVYVQIAEKRSQWMYPQEWLITGQNYSPEALAIEAEYDAYRKQLWENMDKAANHKYCYKVTVDSHPNLFVTATGANYKDARQVTPNYVFDWEGEGHAWFDNPGNIIRDSKELSWLKKILAEEQ